MPLQHRVVGGLVPGSPMRLWHPGTFKGFSSVLAAGLGLRSRGFPVKTMAPKKEGFLNKVKLRSLVSRPSLIFTGQEQRSCRETRSSHIQQVRLELKPVLLVQSEAKSAASGCCQTGLRASPSVCSRGLLKPPARTARRRRARRSLVGVVMYY